MGYKTFVAGEEALAVDVNSYLMGQTVSRFPSAATRTAQLTAPVLNQLTILDDRGLIQRWNGSAWEDTTTSVVSAGVGTWLGPLIQTGSSVATTDPYGSFNVYLPTPFGSAQYICVAMNGDANNLDHNYAFWCGLLRASKTATQFALTITKNNMLVANTIVRVDWIAIGTHVP